MSRTRFQSDGVPIPRSSNSKEFLDIQATIEGGFTLKRVRDMTRTYSQFKFCLDYTCENYLQIADRLDKTKHKLEITFFFKMTLF